MEVSGEQVCTLGPDVVGVGGRRFHHFGDDAGEGMSVMVQLRRIGLVAGLDEREALAESPADQGEQGQIFQGEIQRSD